MKRQHVNQEEEKKIHLSVDSSHSRSRSRLSSLHTDVLIHMSLFLDQDDYLRFIETCQTIRALLTMNLRNEKPSLGLQRRLLHRLKLSVIVTDSLYRPDEMFEYLIKQVEQIRPLCHRLAKWIIAIRDNRSSGYKNMEEFEKEEEGVSAPYWIFPPVFDHLRELVIQHLPRLFHYEEEEQDPEFFLGTINGSQLISNLRACAHTLRYLSIDIPCLCLEPVEYVCFPAMRGLNITWDVNYKYGLGQLGPVCPLFIMMPGLEELEFRSSTLPFVTTGLGSFCAGLPMNPDGKMIRSLKPSSVCITKKSALTELSIHEQEQSFMLHTKLTECTSLTSLYVSDHDRFPFIDPLLRDQDESGELLTDQYWQFPKSITQLHMFNIYMDCKWGAWKTLTGLRHLQLISDIERKDDQGYMLDMTLVSNHCPLLETFVYNIPVHFRIQGVSEHETSSEDLDSESVEGDKMCSWLLLRLTHYSDCLSRLTLLVLYDNEFNGGDTFAKRAKPCICQESFDLVRFYELRHERPHLQVWIQMCQVFYASHYKPTSPILNALQSSRELDFFLERDTDYASYPPVYCHTQEEHCKRIHRYVTSHVQPSETV